MTWVTRLYNRIHGIKFPWLSDFLGIVQNNILVPSLKIVGRIGLQYIQAQIIEENQKDIPGIEKFRNVSTSCRTMFAPKKLANDILDTVIQTTVSQMKFDGEI